MKCIDDGTFTDKTGSCSLHTIQRGLIMMHAPDVLHYTEVHNGCDESELATIRYERIEE
jgi:hypothetical protein